MRLLILLFLFASVTPASAQLDEAEEKKIDTAFGELCECFNAILSSFDPKFRDAFVLSVDNNDRGKELIQEYFTSLDSAQKHIFKRELEVKILNKDSELSKCTNVLVDKYQINLTLASDDQKRYMLQKFSNTENCGLMSKIVFQQLSKKK